MTTRRRFTAAFKANVAQGARRGDKKIQEIVSRQKVHSNQVSAWKRQAMDVWELLRNLEIMRPDQGWVIYIAYIRLRPGTIRMPGELRTAVTVLYRTCCPSPAPLDGGGCTKERFCNAFTIAVFARAWVLRNGIAVSIRLAISLCNIDRLRAHLHG